MHYYKLDSKVADAAFINGEIVDCLAVFDEQDYAKAKIKQGENLIVWLSSGKKFMGEVVAAHFDIKDGYVSGSFRVIRKKS